MFRSGKRAKLQIHVQDLPTIIYRFWDVNGLSLVVILPMVNNLTMGQLPTYHKAVLLSPISAVSAQLLVKICSNKKSLVVFVKSH